MEKNTKNSRLIYYICDADGSLSIVRVFNKKKITYIQGLVCLMFGDVFHNLFNIP